jgi:hypothetical protein
MKEIYVHFSSVPCRLHAPPIPYFMKDLREKKYRKNLDNLKYEK